MTQIIDAEQPAAGWWAPKNRSISDSMSLIGDSMFGHGAIDEGKNQNRLREQTRVDATAKAEAAFRRGDLMEFMAQAIRADPSNSASAEYALAAARLAGNRNLPTIGAPALPPPYMANVAAQLPAGQPYGSTAKPFDVSESNRPAKPPSVWDSAPRTFGPAAGVSKKISPDPYEVFRSAAGLSKKPPNPLNAAGDYDPTQPGATY
jgi:hypothetical protein